MSQQEELGVMPRLTTSRPFARLLAREQEGAILMLTALMMVVLMGIVGLAVDVGHQMTEYRQAQNAADAAALAGAYAVYSALDENSVYNKANLLLKQNGFATSSKPVTFLDSSGAVMTSPVNTSQVEYVKANVSTSFPTYFIRVLGIGSSSVGASATAKVQRVHLCELCVLNQSAKAALTVSGGGNISATNIRIIDNSNNPDALDDSGGGVINDQGTDAEVDVVGSVYGGGTLVPAATTGIQPIPDPLAWLPTPNSTDVPSPPQLLSEGLHGGNSDTIYPGVYSTIDDNSSGTLTLSPGMYIITGNFTVNGNANAVTGNGVMLYFACPSSSPPYFTSCPSGTKGGQLSLNGNGPLNLSAMSTTYANAHYPVANNPGYGGVLVYYDRNNISPMSITGNGSSTSTSSVTGTIYGKSSLVTIAGNGSQATALNSFIVSDQAKFTGSTGSSGGTPTSALSMNFDPGLNAPFSLLDGLVQ